MKILRSVTRRGFSIGTAGYFTVIKPNTWFPATRLPGSQRHSIGHVTGSPQVPEAAEASQTLATATPPRITLLGSDRSLVRLTLSVLSAIAITSEMRLWVIRPR